MSAPKTEVLQYNYQNPHASLPLMIPMVVLCNTPDEVIERNIRDSSAKYNTWLQYSAPHDGVAIMIGGGVSAERHIDEIRKLQREGGTVFAMNAASKWAWQQGIHVDRQVIADAKAETATLVDPFAEWSLFASQCDASTLERAKNLTLWHLEIGGVEEFLPQDRVKKGGYVLIGGGASVGNSALCVAYAQGFRRFHIFGYDSCHTDNRSHAYPQPMNDFIPTVDVTWAGKTYKTSVAMKAQAEKFQLTAQALKQDGCELNVYGDGLLQAMYLTKPHDLTEQQKYQLMWQFDIYREVSPGEQIVDLFLSVAEPSGLIIDYGCGTGRAALKLSEMGHDVLLVDFTDNCRDDEALRLPFLQWDLSHPCPAQSIYGLCTDMLEHVPEDDIDDVIKNIMASSENVFFQISTVPDVMGAAIDQHLHLTVKPYEWWIEKFAELGFIIQWAMKDSIAALIYVASTGDKQC